ncbi:MAG: cysteine synthase [Planctomycetes bacterium RIFCSPLOWO2_02_FULL_50_16]|nr:MAG: cysteine synthase [Planctomycetes bacterium RIFCSPLOWO2_02_FULL_50_16]
MGEQDTKTYTGAPVLEASILQSIGNTPIIRLNMIGRVSKGVSIYAKAEWFNPGGSVKDRPAIRIIEDGEKSGSLKKDKIIIDSTSGNTGIAYAMIGAVKGYTVTLVMPSNISEERKAIVNSYGASIVYTDPLKGSDGAILEVQKIVKETPDKYFFADQYNNPSNPRAHYDTTGVEVWEQTEGEVTHFVAGLGTTGTLMGTGRRLKEFNPDIELIAVEPSTPIHGLEGLKHIETAITPGIYDPKLPDRKIAVDTEDAYKMVKELGQKEGLLVGYSAGAAMKAALEVAKGLKSGVVVVIFPDSGKNYLSTSFWKYY